MQTILTKYLPATETLGARMKATSNTGKSLIMPWNHSHDVKGNAEAAAILLCKREGWKYVALLFTSTHLGFAATVVMPYDVKTLRGIK